MQKILVVSSHSLGIVIIGKICFLRRWSLDDWEKNQQNILNSTDLSPQQKNLMDEKVSGDLARSIPVVMVRLKDWDTRIVYFHIFPCPPPWFSKHLLSAPRYHKPNVGNHRVFDTHLGWSRLWWEWASRNSISRIGGGLDFRLCIDVGKDSVRLSLHCPDQFGEYGLWWYFWSVCECQSRGRDLQHNRYSPGSLSKLWFKISQCQWILWSNHSFQYIWFPNLWRKSIFQRGTDADVPWSHGRFGWGGDSGWKAACKVLLWTLLASS